MFLKNCWYVAARSREVGRALTARTILNEPIVLYRRQDDIVVALENVCPHRKLPLSMGRLRGNNVECGYHGLQFDSTGSCVAAPTQNRIPPSAKVISYPVVEKCGFVWIWMGDPYNSDQSRLYQVANYEDENWGISEGSTLEIDCNYLYITDNLLEPSHVAWVHQTSFAAPGTQDSPLNTEVLDDGVLVSRWIFDRPLPPYYAPFVKFHGNCDRLQHYEVRIPGIAINKSVFTPAGTGGDELALGENAYIMISYNFMTPVDNDRTMYYWFQHRNTDPNDDAVSARLNEGAVMAFNEDRVVLESVHQGMATGRPPHFNLGIDAGSLRFRQLLDTAIAAEQATAT